MQYPISFSRPMRILMTVLACGPGASRVIVDDDVVEVRMGWAFRSRFDRTAVASARSWPPEQRRPMSRGAHGWGGRWLVNGSGDGLVTITLDPPARAHTIGIAVQLRELTVSVEDPDALVGELSSNAG